MSFEACTHQPSGTRHIQHDSADCFRELRVEKSLLENSETHVSRHFIFPFSSPGLVWEASPGLRRSKASGALHLFHLPLHLLPHLLPFVPGNGKVSARQNAADDPVFLLSTGTVSALKNSGELQNSGVAARRKTSGDRSGVEMWRVNPALT